MNTNTCIRQQADLQQLKRCKSSIQKQSVALDYFSDGLELAGNKVRLRILYLLYTEGKLCVCDLSDILEMSVSAVSQHLRKLKDRQCITMERNAQTIFYSLTATFEMMLKPIFSMIDTHKTTARK